MDEDEILDAILAKEGGFVDHPADRGGPTALGVTLSTYSAWLKRAATVDELRELTKDDARQIYRALYIQQPGFGEIADSRLRALIVDSGVNHGPAAATRMLQRALKKAGAPVPEDGVMGPATLAAMKTVDAASLYYKTCAQRVRFYGSLVSMDHTQAVFSAGWANRIASFVES